MVFVPAAKPSKTAADDQGGDADTPDSKHSHYSDGHGIDFDYTERLQHLPQRPPKEEIQHAHEQEKSE
jgi:hypothetical protein